MTSTYKKSKQEVFFKLNQGSLSVKKYADKFEDLYRFVAKIMPLEEIKCYRFIRGLKAQLKTGIAWYEGNIFRELVQKALTFEKARNEEMEAEQRNKKFTPGSSQGFKNKQVNREGNTFPPRFSYGGCGQGSYVNRGQ